MSSVSIQGNASGTGIFTIASPNSSTNQTLTLPDATGTIITTAGGAAISGTTGAFTTTVGVGGATPAASGAGITFPATASASSDANTLDDYEEGTWTPVLTNLTNNATMTSTVGSYIKIGRAVSLQAQVTTSSLGSVSGDLYISGLPFQAESTAGNYAGSVAGTGGNLAITANQSVSLLTDPGTTLLQLFLWDAAAGSTRMQATEWSSDGQIRFSITYFSAT